MSWEDEMMTKIAKKMSDDIDREILDSITFQSLISKGWVKTNIAVTSGSRRTQISWYDETDKWIGENITGDSKLLMGNWIFERDEDAILFLLRWS